MTLAPSTPIPPPNPLALHWLLPALEAQFARLSPALVRYVGSGDPETHDEVCHALAQCAGVFRLLHRDAQARLCQDITRLLEKALSSPSVADQWEAQDGCWNGQQRLGVPLWESREMRFVEIVIRRPQFAGRKTMLH